MPRHKFDPKPVFRKKGYWGDANWAAKQSHDLAVWEGKKARWLDRKEKKRSKPARKAASVAAYKASAEFLRALDKESARKARFLAGAKRRDAARKRWLRKKDAAARMRYSWKK